MKFDASRLFSRSKKSLTRSLHRNNKDSVSEYDDVTVEETISGSDFESSTSQVSTTFPRHVCFDESENVYHDNPLEDKEEWKSVLWYNKEECAALKQANKAHAKRVRSALAKREEHESWAESLGRIYYAFHEANSPRDVQELLDETTIHLDDDVVGVEHMIMSSVTRDISDRRENLLDEIAMIQNDYSLSDKQKRMTIAKLMQTKCRASRVYALYLCHVRANSTSR
uniref:Uncharacterized protein n=1 Tax=Amphora coffeiformis TaxID=265554 RepID=A0A7S3L2Z3_9STRA|mmetsp:Transcript_10294/g.19753  ORF Transcript_10294/g.19753 Transcript_10294/m.19753 type:complete len:226 (+) Transcript_10294:253-930(+)|eukprot:scaffold12005_cov212-Amphora_coffeaeformis.AAC.8